MPGTDTTLQHVQINDRVCGACFNSCQGMVIPQFSEINNVFLPKPFTFGENNITHTLTNVEEKLVAIQVPYMTIKPLYSTSGGTHPGLKGTVINVPSNVNACMKMLPRLPEQIQHYTMRIEWYRQAHHDKQIWAEDIRPNIVHEYMSKLVNTPLYKDNNIRHNNNIDLDVGHEFMLHMTPPVKIHKEDKHTPSNRNANNDSNNENEDSNDGMYQSYGEQLEHDVLIEEFWTIDKIQELKDYNVQIAPTDKQTYAGLLRDINSAEKCFPCIFNGEYRFSNIDRPIKVSRIELLRYYLCIADPRARCNPQFIFYAAQCVQLIQACAGQNVRLRTLKFKDKPLTAADMLSRNTEDQIVSSDYAYRDMRDVYGTPDELLNLKKDINAIIRQLGHFQFFLTFGSSEARDRNVFIQLARLEGNICEAGKEAEYYDNKVDGTLADLKDLKNVCDMLTQKHV